MKEVLAVSLREFHLRIFGGICIMVLPPPGGWLRLPPSCSAPDGSFG
jgi:hypothetical protein